MGRPSVRAAAVVTLAAHSANSKKYIAHLKKQQAEVAERVGVAPDTTYQVTLNGLTTGSYYGVVRYGDSQVRTVLTVDVP